MTRAALYARYSDDKQSEASIEDQFRLCREHAGRERWQIVGSYEDAAISGASTILRPGIQRLMRDALHGEFNILLAEALDRISRDQADVATLFKQLKFAGVSIVTQAESGEPTCLAPVRPDDLRLLRRKGRHGPLGRFGCLNHHRRGTCNNNRTILREKLEARVLAGLQDKLVSTEAVEEAVRAYVQETNRLNHQRRAQQDTDRRALAKIERAIVGIFSAIEDGMYQPSMKARMDELERQKAEIAARMAEAPVDLPDVHPNVATSYSRNVARFAEALNDPDGGRQAAEALRSLIGEVILTPGEKRGEVHAELRGELMGILGIAAIQPDEGRARVMTAVVAGPGAEPTPEHAKLRFGATSILPEYAGSNWVCFAVIGHAGPEGAFARCSLPLVPPSCDYRKTDNEIKMFHSHAAQDCRLLRPEACPAAHPRIGLDRKMWRAPNEKAGGVLWETGTGRRRSFGVKRCVWR